MFQAVTYQKTVFNTNGDMNTGTGEFVCRVAGAYYFNFHSLAKVTHHCLIADAWLNAKRFFPKMNHVEAWQSGPDKVWFEGIRNSEPGCFDQVWSLCIANQDSQVTITVKSPGTGVTTLNSERKVVVCVFRSAYAWLSSVTLKRPPGSVSVTTSGTLSRSVNSMLHVLKSRRRPHSF